MIFLLYSWGSLFGVPISTLLKLAPGQSGTGPEPGIGIVKRELSSEGSGSDANTRFLLLEREQSFFVGGFCGQGSAVGIQDLGYRLRSHGCKIFQGQAA